MAIGNYNLPHINWETLSSDSSITNTFWDLIFDLNFNQLQGSPSHICGNILDLLLTNYLTHISSLWGLPNSY